MPVLAFKQVGIAEFEEILVSPFELKKELQIVVCNVGVVDDYLFFEIETANGLVPIFWNLPVLAYDTYTVPFVLALGKDEKYLAKSISGGLVISIHEKIQSSSRT